MARGRHYAKLSLSNAARLSFSDLCILLFMFLSLCRLCVCVFLCSHWSLVDVPLIFFCPADHVPDWQPRVLLGMVEARSVNVKKTTTTTTLLLLYVILNTVFQNHFLHRGGCLLVQRRCSRGYETAEVRDVRRNGGRRGLCGRPGKRVDGVFPGRSQSFRHQRRPVDDCRGNGAERQNKGRNISWRHGSLQGKPRLDYGMQWYART